MNLYGENGNVRIIEKKLKEQDIDVEIALLSVGDKIDFKKYDLYYIGAGSENNEIIVLEDIKKYKQDIIDAINDKKYFICTGNSLELFGKSILIEGTEYNGVGVFDYSAKPVDNANNVIVGKQYFKTDLIAHSIIGFQNRINVINDKGDNLFKVIDGTGYNENVDYEGIHDNNFFGTYLIGPLLVRNPYLCDYFIKEFCKLLDVEYKELSKDGYEYKAYNEYLKNFLKDLNG
jgi:CobQ-like glutamine amidotransferase family enzyme